MEKKYCNLNVQLTVFPARLSCCVTVATAGTPGNTSTRLIAVSGFTFLLNFPEDFTNVLKKNLSFNDALDIYVYIYIYI